MRNRPLTIFVLMLLGVSVQGVQAKASPTTTPMGGGELN